MEVVSVFMTRKLDIETKLQQHGDAALAKIAEISHADQTEQLHFAIELESIVASAYKLASQNDAYDLLPDHICDLDQYLGHLDEPVSLQELVSAIEAGRFRRA
jgi:hypothetical protein